MKKIIIKHKKYTISEIFNICNGEYSITLHKDVVNKIQSSRKSVDKVSYDKNAVYGINTGFGKLSQIKIDNQDLDLLQSNLLISHAVGVGNPCPDIVVKIMLLLKIVSFTKGFSGVRLELVQFLVKLFNNDCLPIIPEKGSVGASGDLAPLSHMSLPIIGEGKLKYKNKVLNSKNILNKIGITPITLKKKEGLALINGTQFSTAYGVYCLNILLDLVKTCDVSGAMSVEAMMGSKKPFSKKVNKLKEFSGQIKTSTNLTNILKNSEIMKSHNKCSKVQDIYSLRCMPQVHGSSRDLIDFSIKQINIEINSVSDNPLVFNNGDIVSAGHFHAEAVGHALDIAAISLASLSNISERRIFAMLSGDYNLPQFLINNPGINSGFMMLQVTAAALASENKVLSNPSSVDSIPTCSNQEDYVSMAPYSGRKLYNMVENFQSILAIELFCAVQAIDFRNGLKPAEKLIILHKLIRSKVPFLNKDRLLKKDLDNIIDMIKNGTILDAISKELNLL